MKTIFAAFLLLCLSLAAADVPVTLPDRTFTSEQATSILQKYNNPSDIVGVIKAAIKDPAINTVVLAWADKPLSTSAPPPLKMWRDTADAYRKFFGRSEAEGIDYGETLYRPLTRALAEDGSQPAWGIFRHLAESNYSFLVDPQEFGKVVKPDSAAEAAFLDYLPKATKELKVLATSDGRFDIPYGLFDLQTGNLRVLREKDSKTNFDSEHFHLNPVWDIRPSFYGNSVSPLYLYADTDSNKIFAWAQKTIFAGSLWETMQMCDPILDYEPGMSVPVTRTDRDNPRIFFLYRQLLSLSRNQNPSAIIVAALKPFGHADNSPSPPYNSTSSATWSELRAFISESENLDITPEASRCLAHARQQFANWLSQQQELHYPFFRLPDAAPLSHAEVKPPASTTAPLPSAAEATKILEVDKDYLSVLSALQTLLAGRTTRPIAVAFLNHDHDQEQYLPSWIKLLPRQDLTNTKNKIDREYITYHLQKLSDAAEARFIRFLAESTDPTLFEVAQYLLEHRNNFNYKLIDHFEEYLIPGSVMEEQYLNYLRNGILYQRVLDYENAKHQRHLGGMLDTRTGVFTPAMTDQEKSDFSPVYEFSRSRNNIADLLHIGSPRAMAMLHEIVSSPQIENLIPRTTKPDPQPLDLQALVGGPRYRPAIIELLHELLLNPAWKDKDSLIQYLFDPRDTHPSDVIFAPIDQGISDTTYAAYPLLRTFIADVEKPGVSATVSRSLIQTKVALDWFESQRNIPYQFRDYINEIELDASPDYNKDKPWKLPPPPDSIAPANPIQALSALSNDRNWDDLVPALETAATNSTVQAKALDFLDHPPPASDFFEINFRTRAELAAELAGGLGLPPPVLRYSRLDALMAYWGKTGSLDTFELFRHFVQSRLATEMYSTEVCFRSFAGALPPGSPAEAPFEQFMIESVLDWRSIIDPEPPAKNKDDRRRDDQFRLKTSSVTTLFNRRTGESIVYLPGHLTPSATQANTLSQALYTYGWFHILTIYGTDSSYATAGKILLSDDYWKQATNDDIQNTFSSYFNLPLKEIDPRLLALYRQMIFNPHARARDFCLAITSLCDRDKDALALDWATVSDDNLSHWLKLIDEAETQELPFNPKANLEKAKKLISGEQTRRNVVSAPTAPN